MRKQIFLSVLFAFATFSMAFAQFPLMDLVGNTVSISPTTYQFAVGANSVTDPNTKVLINGGKLEMRIPSTLSELIKINHSTGLGASYFFNTTGAVNYFDASVSPINTSDEGWFSHYLNSNFTGAKGLRLSYGCRNQDNARRRGALDIVVVKCMRRCAVAQRRGALAARRGQSHQHAAWTALMPGEAFQQTDNWLVACCQHDAGHVSKGLSRECQRLRRHFQPAEPS